MTTDNRTNEPTEAQVEAAASAICEAFPYSGGGSKIVYEEAEHAARAALVAAQGAAPVLPSSGVDEDALAEVIAKSRGFGNGWEQIPPLTRGAYREIARAVAEWLKEQGR